MPLSFKGIPKQSSSFPSNKAGLEKDLRQPRLASHSEVRVDLKLQVSSLRLCVVLATEPRCSQALHHPNHSLQSFLAAFCVASYVVHAM